METRETENEQKVKKTANNFIVRFWNFAKNENFALLASRPQRPVVAGMKSPLKKLLADCFKTFNGRPEDLTVSGPLHLYFTVCLDSSFRNQEDKKSNSTEQACWVPMPILSPTSLPAQKTSHILQPVSLLAKYVFSVCLNQWQNWRFEPGRRNLAEWGSLATEGGEKKLKSECFRMWVSILKPEKSMEDEKTIYWKPRILDGNIK